MNMSASSACNRGVKMKFRLLHNDIPIATANDLRDSRVEPEKRQNQHPVGPQSPRYGGPLTGSAPTSPTPSAPGGTDFENLRIRIPVSATMRPHQLEGSCSRPVRPSSSHQQLRHHAPVAASTGWNRSRHSAKGTDASPYSLKPQVDLRSQPLEIVINGASPIQHVGGEVCQWFREIWTARDLYDRSWQQTASAK